MASVSAWMEEHATEEELRELFKSKLVFARPARSFESEAGKIWRSRIEAEREKGEQAAEEYRAVTRELAARREATEREEREAVFAAAQTATDQVRGNVMRTRSRIEGRGTFLSIPQGGTVASATRRAARDLGGSHEAGRDRSYLESNSREGKEIDALRLKLEEAVEQSTDVTQSMKRNEGVLTLLHDQFDRLKVRLEDCERSGAAHAIRGDVSDSIATTALHITQLESALRTQSQELERLRNRAERNEQPRGGPMVVTRQR